MASKKFSSKLKDLRLKAGYNQKDVYEHFGIPQSTFSSWEVGKSEPSGEMLLKLCAFYKCDMMKEFSSEDILTYKEWNVIEKYRSLDDFGKKHIDDELDHEVKRVQQIHKLQDSSPSPSLDSAAGPEPQASSDAAAAEAAYEKRLGIVPAAGSSASSTTGAAGGKIG